MEMLSKWKSNTVRVLRCREGRREARDERRESWRDESEGAMWMMVPRAVCIEVIFLPQARHDELCDARESKGETN